MASEPTYRGPLTITNEKYPRTSNDKSSGSDGPRTDVETGENQGLNRELHSRHLQFIAIGAALGTGIFLGIGSALSKAGPASLLIAFVFIGSVLYSVVTALGEMAAYMPVTGAFTVYATRFVDPTLGFSMGWIYWFSWVITVGLELTAGGLIIEYWNDKISIGVWISIFWVIFTAANYMPVRWFGEMEMWFSSIKVVTIAGFIIFGICVNAGVGDQGYIGFKYWRDPGAFANFNDGDTWVIPGAVGKFVGFWAVLITAGFSYQGTELVAIAAGETANPRKAIPSAIKSTFWGIFGLFLATIFFVGINIPHDNPGLTNASTNASASPLVIVAQLAGVRVLPSIINAVLLTAVLSAANSDIYSSSRILVSMAEVGHAPSFIARTNKLGTPIYAVGICAAFGLLAFLNLSANGTVVFNWLLNITSVAGFITWSLINVCHLRFMKVLKVQGISRDSLPYKAPFQPYLSWFGVFFNVLILLTNGFTVFIRWNTSSFFASYVSVILFIVLYVGHKIVYRTKLVPLAEVDLVTGRSEE
ncbi:Arginine permease CAN1 [Cladobotryum mycophilum]|uniref:Arginine permease CAN1 n=1 Tax=Cladobotryum mycophilum TaxID=491253 RepID=A0ABR0SCB3_9HYPO